MRIRIARRAVCGVAGAAALLLAGVAQAALQDRDLNGDTVVDAFYDTDLGITWLRDANAIGLKPWNVAAAWADNFSLGGYDDWRLPTSDTCRGSNCSGSEMGHLWITELGNSAANPRNTGNFQNLEENFYWSGTDFAQDPSAAWYFLMSGAGYQYAFYKEQGSTLYAMAVHPGDVGAVPEPETYALMLAGLAALAVAPRRPR